MVYLRNMQQINGTKKTLEKIINELVEAIN